MQKKPYKYFMSDGTPVKKKCIDEEICYQAVLKYMGRGMSPDEAFERARITKFDPFRFLGRLRCGDESLSRYCRRNGLSYNKVYGRIRDKCMTVEEALSWKN